MKTYKVKLLTTQGVKEVIVKENEVHKIEAEMMKLYGTFITLSSKEILN